MPYSLHPYQYGYSDPMLWTDPSGEQSEGDRDFRTDPPFIPPEGLDRNGWGYETVTGDPDEEYYVLGEDGQYEQLYTATNGVLYRIRTNDVGEPYPEKLYRLYYDAATPNAKYAFANDHNVNEFIEKVDEAGVSNETWAVGLATGALAGCAAIGVPLLLGGLTTPVGLTFVVAGTVGVGIAAVAIGGAHMYVSNQRYQEARPFYDDITHRGSLTPASGMHATGVAP
jgi:hypothetical protein